MSEAEQKGHPAEDKVRQAWWQLENQGLRLRRIHLRSLFAEDAGRGAELSRRGGGLFLDFSKEKLDAESFSALLALAEVAQVAAQKDALFSASGGEAFFAAGRAHIALRADTESAWLKFADAVREGSEKGVKGSPFRDVVHIGSGGAIQGARLLVEALAEKNNETPRAHFLDGADGVNTSRLLAKLNAETTLVVVSSKSMATAETLAKARSLCDWLEQKLGTDIGAHLVAVTADSATARANSAALGIKSERIFTYPEAVCGRNSIWGATALTAAIALGTKTMRDFIKGGGELDAHFRDTPLADNLPVLLALIGVWRRNIMGWPSVALVPYDARLGGLIAQLRQLEMESNGKSAQRNGANCPRPTAPVIWGGVGTEAQHSFFQALHQGTDVTPTDFLLPATAQDTTQDDDNEPHMEVLANCLAQARALAFGLAESEVASQLAGASRAETAQRALSGDRPSTILVFDKTDARNLGRLVALWEHKVFCQAVLWNINPYDQHGVEYGKNLAQVMLAEMRGEALPAQTANLPRFAADSSTPQLVKVLIKQQAQNDSD